MADTTDDKPYILWLDYGTENWKMERFETLQDMAAYIQAGQTFGQKFIVTKEIKFRIERHDIDL